MYVKESFDLVRATPIFVPLYWQLKRDASIGNNNLNVALSSAKAKSASLILGTVVKGLFNILSNLL